MYWVIGILIVSGILVTFASDFSERQTVRSGAGSESVQAASIPLHPGEEGFLASQGADVFSDDDSESSYVEDSSDLDGWYASTNSGASAEPFDPSPEDKSYLINSTEPYEASDPFSRTERELPIPPPG